MASSGQRGAIALAERMMTLLDQGRITTTYKYAVLLGLMDLCLENTARSGTPPAMVTTRQMADKVVELYWPQVLPYVDSVLRQTRGRRDQRASILAEVQAFRDAAARRLGQALPLLGRARLADPDGYEECVRAVEWTLIRYPLVLLQRVGGEDLRFLYEIGWDEQVRHGDVKRYQRSEGSPFDNRLLLRPLVGEHLVQLTGLLRPMIHRQWTAAVARMNDLEEAKLEEFLFGARRISLAAVRMPLLEIQDGRCFYCDQKVGGSPEVDHFLPWSRYPDNRLENLVIADRPCNANKRDFLAATAHVDRWRVRCEAGRAEAAALDQLARDLAWEHHPERTLSVARAIYLQLPEEVLLWLRPDQFVRIDRAALRAALARPPT